MPIYATAEQYEAYSHETAPPDIEKRLDRASEFLDAQVFRYCWYVASATTGLPTDSVVAAAFARAVCAQVEWGLETGDLTGAAAAGWGSFEIGDVKLGRSVTSVSGADAPGRQVAPAVGDALRSPLLTPDKFVMGVVASC